MAEALKDFRRSVNRTLGQRGVPAELVRAALEDGKYVERRRREIETLRDEEAAPRAEKPPKEKDESVRVVVVTGCCGRLGRGVCSELLDAGFRVLGYDRLRQPPVGLPKGVRYTCGTLEEVARLRRLVSGRKDAYGTYALVHLAACPDDADFTDVLLPSNIIGVHNVLSVCEEAKVERVVVASSGKLYAKPSTPLPIKPTDPVGVVCQYGASKLFAEGAAQAFAHRTEISTTVLRFAWCPRTSADVRAMRAAAKEAAGSGTHEFLSPGDAGRCVCAALTAAPPFAILFCQSRPPADGQWRFDMSETTRVLGWQPTDTFPDGPEGETWIDTLVAAEDYTPDPALYPRVTSADGLAAEGAPPADAPAADAAPADAPAADAAPAEAPVATDASPTAEGTAEGVKPEAPPAQEPAAAPSKDTEDRVQPPRETAAQPVPSGE